MTIRHDVNRSGEQTAPVPWTLRRATCDDVVSVPHTLRIRDVISQIAGSLTDYVIAVRDGEPVGSVSVRDLAQADDNSVISEVCTPPRWSRVAPDVSLAEAERLFRTHGVDLLLLDDDAKPAHWLSRAGLAAAAIRETEELRRWLTENANHSSQLEEGETQRPEATTVHGFSESRYQAILEAQPECVKVVDRNGRLLEMNPAGLRVMEADNFEQVRGVEIASLLEPAHQANYRAWEQRVLAGEKATLIFEAEGLKGTRKWLEAIGAPLRDASGEIGAVLAVTRDITDRVTTEKQLRESEERLSKIFNGLPYYLTLFSVEGELTLFNRTALQSPGFSVDVLKNRQIWETEWINFNPAIVERVRTAFHRAQQGKSSQFDCPIRMSTGEMKQMEVTVHPVCDTDGKVKEILGAGVDITARVEAEEQARRLREEIAHASRLSTLGEMAANIAHELNQPLAAIVNYAFSARRILNDIGTNATEQTAKYLGVVEDQALRAGQIVRSLQQLVRKTSSRQVSADLGRIFEDVLSLIKSDLYHEKIELITNFSPLVPVVYVDAVQIQQVLLNLLRNSIEAVAGVSTTRRIEIATSRHGPDVVVTVSDTGTGISSLTNGDILDAFVTTKPDGLGLGLTISRRIIEAHGGKLSYESQPGRGTTFVFTLPVAQHKETGE